MTGIRAALGCLGVLLATAATAAPIPNLKGETYVQTRAKLIKLGYEPVRFMRTEDGCLLDKTCKQYPELLKCSPKGPVQCEFAFRNGRRDYLVVTTRGEAKRVDSITAPSQRERSQWPLLTQPKAKNRSGQHH